MKSNSKDNIVFVIHPIDFNYYDIIAIGSWRLLSEMSHENKEYHLILKSKFGGIPILIIDTCDKISDAVKIVKDLRRGRRNET